MFAAVVVVVVGGASLDGVGDNTKRLAPPLTVTSRSALCLEPTFPRCDSTRQSSRPRSDFRVAEALRLK